MKIALDEHIAPKVINAVKALLEDDRHGDIEIVLANDYAEPPAKSDVPWLRKFALDNGKIVITADKRMRSRVYERKALSDLGLIGIFMPPQWNALQFMNKASYILRWWDCIVECIKSAEPGTCWQLPNNWNANVDKIKNVTGHKKTD